MTREKETKIFGIVSLKTKFVAIFVAVVLFMGLATILIIQNLLSTALLTEIKERGLSIARNLVVNSSDLILTDNILGISQLLTRAKEAEKNVSYIFITDSKKQVLAHTFEGGFPINLLEANALSPDKEQNIQLLDTKEGHIYDFAFPILKGELGIVRLGISEEYIRQNIIDIILRIIVFVSLISIIGIVFNFLFITFTIKPLKKLTEVAEEIKKGRLGVRVEIKSKDEIGQLASVFNEMTEQLTAYSGELEKKVAERTQELEKAKSGLEEKVALRTSELEKAKSGLEEKVGERTKELSGKVEELERFYDLTVGREMKMIELKKEIERLKAK